MKERAYKENPLLAGYRNFRRTKAAHAIDAIVPFLPMAPMPREGWENPFSNAFNQQQEETHSHVDFHAIAGSFEALIGGGVLIGAVLFAPEIAGTIAIAAAGLTLGHLGRMTISSLRESFHGFRKNHTSEFAAEMRLRRRGLQF